MKEFELAHEDVLVTGNVVGVFLDAFGAYRTRGEKVIARYLADDDDSSLPDGNYPAHKILLGFRDLQQQFGRGFLNRVGQHVYEQLSPPGLDTFDTVLAAMNQAYQMNHLNGDGKIGCYDWMKLTDRSGRMQADNPYPCAFDKGLFIGIAKQFSVRSTLRTRTRSHAATAAASSAPTFSSGKGARMNDRQARIAHMERVLSCVADGDFEQRIELSGDHDELSNLEMGINFMVMDLRTMMEANRDSQRRLREQAADLEAQLERIRLQATAIRELTTPAIEIWDNVLALPIIGVLDSRRMAEIMDNLLGTIARTQTRYVVIDLTGVDVVDTHTADHLLKIVHAAKLLGTRCMLTGLSPAVVQILTHIGADLSNVTTLRNLKKGLRHCLNGGGLSRSDSRAHPSTS